MLISLIYKVHMKWALHSMFLNSDLVSFVVHETDLRTNAFQVRQEDMILDDTMTLERGNEAWTRGATWARGWACS